MKENQFSELLKVLKKSLVLQKPVYTSEFSANYHGAGKLKEYASNLTFLGHNVPQTKVAAKQVLEYCNLNFDPPNFADIVNIFVSSQIYEEKLVCLHTFIFAFKKNKAEIEFCIEKNAQKIAEKIDCWPLADLFCSIQNLLLRENFSKMIHVIDNMRKSKNPWVERIGLVSLIYYTTPKLRPNYLTFDELIARIEKHLSSKDLYVQKGVGWQLRELGKAFPSEYFSWYKKNALNLTTTAFSAASEKLTVAQKKSVLEIRKQNRVRS